jgi:hypothetical protein
MGVAPGPLTVAGVRELLAPYGDKARLYLDGLLTHPSAGGTAASRLRSFIRVRCAGRRRSVVRTRPAARAVIRRVTVNGGVLTGTGAPCARSGSGSS